MIPNQKSQIKNLCIIILMLVGVLVWVLRCGDVVTAGSYTSSAHGNATTGVDRNASFPAYAVGNCAHCHEMHASIAGTEPAPTGGSPSDFCLFANNFSGKTINTYAQSDDFCFYCHTNTGSVQTSTITNNNYSATFGGATATVTGIMQAFNQSSYHNLNDVLNFAKGTSGWPSTFTANSNPCSACHNVHRAKRNKANTGDPTYTAISKPSAHSELWGDDTGETLRDYTISYQAPYYYSSTTNYEPDNSSVEPAGGWGSNMPDYNTFCTDCHNSTNTIYSTTLVRNLRTIDWDNEKHGKGNADSYITVDSPYTSGSGSLGYVLSCTDCHEPHGSPNAFLIRKDVNGGTLGGSITTFSTTNWHYLCDRCHQDDYELTTSCQEDHYYNIHHSSTYGGDPYYTGGMCGSCHSGSGSGCTSSRNKLVCTDCHYHGSTHSSRVTF